MGNKKDYVYLKDLEDILAGEVSKQEESELDGKKEELRAKRRQRELRQRKKRRKRMIQLTSVILLLVGVFGGFFLYRNSLVYKVCRIEAGGAVTPADFLKKADDKACFTEKSDQIDTTIPGEYYVEIKTGLFTVSSKLIVQDTVAPVLAVCNIAMTYGETCEAQAFVTSLKDETQTAVSFATEPDFSICGKQTVTIIATDLGGNTMTQQAQLTVSPVIPAVHVELGSALPDISELVVEGVVAEYVTAPPDCNTVGNYTVVLRTGEEEYEMLLIVEDTVAPDLEVQDVMDYAVFEKKPEDFVVSAADLSGVTLSYKEEPDYNYIGEQNVIIVATDECGNSTEKEATLIQVPDEDAPVFLSGKDFVVFLGDTVAYKSKVTVTDNCEYGLELSVDASAVDLKTIGEYPVVYTATDAAGNIATKTLMVTVKEYRADEVELYNKIDAILADLITEDMSEREKCQKIYNYIRSVVSYVSYSDKGDWIGAAMEGLTKGKGDCYVFFSLSKAMLTCAGIPNLDIEKIRVGDSMHYWNLVDLGDGHGWYHFDATPRKDKTVIFLWDDEKLWNYSNSHNGSHNYDITKYPEIN